MANGSTTTAIVLKVTCGQKLSTTIGGVAVQIECAAEETQTRWKFPPPPSGAGGVLGVVEVAADERRLDLDAVVEAFREERLHEEAVPLEADESATIFFEDAAGGLSSLDTMLRASEGE